MTRGIRAVLLVAALFPGIVHADPSAPSVPEGPAVPPPYQAPDSNPGPGAPNPGPAAPTPGPAAPTPGPAAPTPGPAAPSSGPAAPTPGPSASNPPVQGPAVPAPAARPAVPGEQTITILLRGLSTDSKVDAERAGGETIRMADPGLGLLAAEFHGPPVRFLQLRLTLEANGERRPIYDGMIVLADKEHERIAFQFQDREAVRLPMAPSAQTEIALDQRTTWWISFGWGALTLGWVGLMAALWARTRA